MRERSSLYIFLALALLFSHPLISLSLSFSLSLSLRSLLFSRLYLFVEAKENKTEERRKRVRAGSWRGVGARIKGAVRLEGAPNYDVTDRTRRDQVSRIQNGLLITGPFSPSNCHGGRHLPQAYFSEALCVL